MSDFLKKVLGPDTEPVLPHPVTLRLYKLGAVVLVMQGHTVASAQLGEFRSKSPMRPGHCPKGTSQPDW